MIFFRVGRPPTLLCLQLTPTFPFFLCPRVGLSDHKKTPGRQPKQHARSCWPFSTHTHTHTHQKNPPPHRAWDSTLFPQHTSTTRNHQPASLLPLLARADWPPLVRSPCFDSKKTHRTCVLPSSVCTPCTRRTRHQALRCPPSHHPKPSVSLTPKAYIYTIVPRCVF